MSYKDSVIAPTAKDTPGRLRWGLAAIFFIIGLIAYMDRANISIVAEHMMTDLGMSKVQFGFLGALFSLGYALAQIPSGILAERFGSRLIATISLYVWSAFTILTVVAPTYLWLCIVRFSLVLARRLYTLQMLSLILGGFVKMKKPERQASYWQALILAQSSLLPLLFSL